MTSISSGEAALDYELRPSAGLFYDRGGSLLWSVIINGTENLKLRANIYLNRAGISGEL